MDMNETIGEIKWLVEDVATYFENKYDRLPTEKELEDILDNLNTKRMEDSAIEDGWNFIDEAIWTTMEYQKQSISEKTPERNYAWYTYKGEEVVIVGQHVDNSFETEKFNGIKPLETSDNAAILRISDIENAGIKITPDDVQNSFDDSEGWNEPVEIICEQIVNPENNQHLSPYTFVTESYFNEDLIERELLTNTTKYHEWTSERTRFFEEYREEDFTREETLKEWLEVCSKITSDYSKYSSKFDFDNLWEEITYYRAENGIDNSEHVVESFLEKVKNNYKDDDILLAASNALKTFSAEEKKDINNFLSSKGMLNQKKLENILKKETSNEQKKQSKNKDCERGR